MIKMPPPDFIRMAVGGLRGRFVGGRGDRRVRTGVTFSPHLGGFLRDHGTLVIVHSGIVAIYGFSANTSPFPFGPPVTVVPYRVVPSVIRPPIGCDPFKPLNEKTMANAPVLVS